MLIGDCDAHEAQLGELFHLLEGKQVLTIMLRRQRREHVVGELAGNFADVFVGLGKLEHPRRISLGVRAANVDQRIRFMSACV